VHGNAALIRLKPDHAEAHNNLGVAFYQQRRTDEAIRQFQEALSLKPDCADARIHLTGASRMPSARCSPKKPNPSASCWARLCTIAQPETLRHALHEYLAHHQHERNHPGLDNVIPFPDERTAGRASLLRKSERLRGLLNFYHRAAA
jgi:tetratricopeptide (TPR) repeat protein